jgi:hypothetical protein
MRNKELESIAVILANRQEETTDRECLDTVWKYLVGCGIDPADYHFKEETPDCSPGGSFVVGQELAVRSLGDWDCVFRFKVVKRSAKFVTLLYHGIEHKVVIRQWSDAVEYCYPLGTYSMAPALRSDSVVA